MLISKLLSRSTPGFWSKMFSQDRGTILRQMGTGKAGKRHELVGCVEACWFRQVAFHCRSQNDKVFIKRAGCEQQELKLQVTFMRFLCLCVCVGGGVIGYAFSFSTSSDYAEMFSPTANCVQWLPPADEYPLPPLPPNPQCQVLWFGSNN